MRMIARGIAGLLALGALSLFLLAGPPPKDSPSQDHTSREQVFPLCESEPSLCDTGTPIDYSVEIGTPGELLCSMPWLVVEDGICVPLPGHCPVCGSVSGWNPKGSALKVCGRCGNAYGHRHGMIFP